MLTEEQLAMRLTGIGGSEIAAVVGLNKYATAMDVYLSKVEGRTLEANHHMERGTFLEPGLANWYAHRTGAVLREVGTLRHPKRPVVMCTPDRLAKLTRTADPDREIDLSIKAPYWTGDEWGESGTSDVPDAYSLQVQWELVVLGELYGIHTAHIAAPIKGDLRIYPIRADEELQAMLVGAAERFFRDYVEKRVPPPVDGSGAWADELARAYPRPHGKDLLPADEAMMQIARRLAAAKARRELAEAEEQEARNQLVARIGDAYGIEGIATYGYTKGRASTNWQAVATEAGVPEALIQRHTTIGAGHRTLRLKLKGEDNE